MNIGQSVPPDGFQPESLRSDPLTRQYNNQSRGSNSNYTLKNINNYEQEEKLANNINGPLYADSSAVTSVMSDRQSHVPNQSLLPSTGLHARTSVTTATGVTGLSGIAGIAAAAANQQGKPLNLAALTLAAQSVAAKKRAGARAQAANTRPERTLFCLTLRNSLRKVCIKIGEWKYPLYKRFD